MTGPRRFRLASAMALCALGAALTVMPILYAKPLATPEQRDLAQARENAKWEQAIAARRLGAFLREEPAPVRWASSRPRSTTFPSLRRRERCPRT